MERHTRRPIPIGAINLTILSLAIALFSCGFFFEDRNVRDAPTIGLANMRAADLLRLPIKNGAGVLHIDAIEVHGVPDISLGPLGSSLLLPAGADVRFVGWAIDLPARRSASAAFISIDRANPTACGYGFDRPDVATAYGIENDTASGLRCDVAAKSLRAGRHRISFSLVNAAGTAYERIDLPQTFLVNGTHS